MTPNFAVIAIQTPQRQMPRFWVPLFLLWIPVLLLSPILFLVLIAWAIAAKTSIWRIIATFWQIVSALSGTHVHVRSEGTQITVRIL